MRVLVACETSGKVREAFRAKGHDCWSCDLLPSDDGSNYHIIGDALDAIEHMPKMLFGGDRWDLIIAHPPCTALAVSGNRWYAEGMPKHAERLEAIKWTRALWALCTRMSGKVCFENPVGVLTKTATEMGKPHYVQPWQFGHGETKKTGLWTAGLPKLQPTDIVEGREQRVWKMGPSEDRWKLRSETYQGIADALAAQYG